jgi:3-deoxy-D-manno-octulosonate 8-phosphate phosphatase (KDO 8-P phosphatase)
LIYNKQQDTCESAARGIRLLLLDVDGVLTDGSLLFSNSGEEMKAFSTLDGHGIKMLIKSGIQVGIITGRTSKLVEQRASDLGIEILIQGREDKLIALDEILVGNNIEKAAICYVGDDLPDLAVMRAIGLSASVPNGHPDVKSAASFVTERRGGQGAVREVADYLLKAQGLYQALLDQ